MTRLALGLLVLTTLGAFEEAPITSRDVFRQALDRLGGETRERLPGALFDFVETFIEEGFEERSVSERAARRRALLLGLGALFDPTDLLGKTPLVRNAMAGIVRPEESQARSSLVARFYLAGRHDTMQHFFVSAALATVLGPFPAERLGRYKELADARRLESAGSGCGYSFVDLAYNLAGVRYAVWLLGRNDRSRLNRRPPPLEAFLPDFTGLELPEKIRWTEFQKRFQGEHEAAFRRETDRIHAAIDASLEAHQKKQVGK
jgi:hypothetical protein